MTKYTKFDEALLFITFGMLIGLLVLFYLTGHNFNKRLGALEAEALPTCHNETIQVCIPNNETIKLGSLQPCDNAFLTREICE